MGWASYFEQISLRHSEPCADDAFVGPAGTLQAEMSPGLVGAYKRLASRYTQVGPDIIRRYQTGEWQDLSDQMDTLAGEVRHFNRNTLLGSEQQLVRETDFLSQRLDTVVAHAKSIVKALGARILLLQNEMTKVETVKRANAKTAISKSQLVLEQDTLWLLHGWRAFKEQTQELEALAVELQIQLAGDVFDRLMTKPIGKTKDKDAESENKHQR